ncbi:ATP-dependent endonuclease [Thermodesulfobacteriota bacterium]
MTFPLKVEFTISQLFRGQKQTLEIRGGLTTFVGPNGSGKSQAMRSIKASLRNHPPGARARYLSGGRLAQLEIFRSNVDGQREPKRPDNLTFGGPDMAVHRHASETAMGDFHSLSVRPDLRIKVAARLSALFRRDLEVHWATGSLKVSFRRTGTNKTFYPCAREASGLLHLVVILSALYDEEVGALLIDEPETSLHPQLQAFLFREIRRVAGDPRDHRKKIVIIATHSTAFLDVSDPESLSRLVFFSNAETPPLQPNPAAGELRNSRVEKLLSSLADVHRMAFFTDRWLLVEGTSDENICNALDRRLGLFLGVSGTQIVPIGGKGRIPAIVKLVRTIGKKPIILADLDLIADDLSWLGIFENDPEADAVANTRGYRNMHALVQDALDDFCKLCDSNCPDVSEHAEPQPNSSDLDSNKLQKARRRDRMAVLLSSTEAGVRHWNNSGAWSAIRTRLSSAFDALEDVGCFLLRKGPLEQYYQTENANSGVDKGVISAEEARRIMEADVGAIIDQYGDIVRALEFASIKPALNEVSEVRDSLLSVVSPVIARLREDPNIQDPASLAQKDLGDKAALFKFENASSGTGEPILRVSLKSRVLEIEGFPIDFPKDRDPIKVAAALQSGTEV